MLDAGLDEAYRATRYQLTVDGQQLSVRVGEKTPELALALHAIGATRWAFITAWNPRSELTPAAENSRFNAMLFQSITGRQYAPAIALPDDTSWPREPGFVLFDFPLSELLALAEKFGQNAVVVGQGGDAPELVWAAKSAD